MPGQREMSAVTEPASATPGKRGLAVPLGTGRSERLSGSNRLA
jgi:hypothetical protein